VAPLLVAYGYPALRLGPGCGQRREDIGIGHFNAISSVEALDVRVLRRTTGLDEIPGDVVVFRPRLQDMASEFRAIAPRGQASRSLRIDVDFLLPAIRVIRSLDQIIEWRGKPTAIRCDNGPEYISGALQQWAAGAALVRFDRAGATLSHPLAVDLQSRTTQYGHRRHHPHAETRHGCIAPLPKSVRNGGITGWLRNRGCSRPISHCNRDTSRSTRRPSKDRAHEEIKS
jgi:hypothetical protein